MVADVEREQQWAAPEAARERMGTNGEGKMELGTGVEPTTGSVEEGDPVACYL